MDDQRQKLDAWFNEAKQSLAVAGPICTEANNLVQSSRQQIEQATAYWAQIVFMHEAIDEQLEMLQHVQKSVGDFETRVETQLEECITDLEKKQAKLSQSLEQLHGTTLDNAFQSGDTKKTLASFVSEEGIDSYSKNIKLRVDQAKSCEADLKQSADDLTEEVSGLNKQRSFKKELRNDTGLEKAHEGTDEVVDHAHAMALLLESLTRHYDQCLQAVESTTIDEELLQVLENDSQEVAGVVNELYERRKSMQQSSQSVSQFNTRMQELHKKMKEYFQTLDEFVTVKLPQYLDLFEGYSRQHLEYASYIEKLSTEVGSLVDYYQRFFQSYQAMVLELLRRSKAETALQDKCQEASQMLMKAYNEEMEHRKQFIQDRGDYLPVDLWPGLTQQLDPPKVTFEMALSTPKLADETIQTAARYA